MAHIQVLQPHTANQIAAGEVVERPASVVKELVENAIDAHATAVSVEIEDGGTRSIVVVDNGDGIPAPDCRAAFLRHATSKIRTIEDLSTLQTMGFRGEALASIASVSSIVMTTRTRDSETGTRLVVERGSVVSEDSAACVCGTAMCVNELFSSVPARLKFLKSNRTEAGYVGDFMARVILSHPEIAFRYLSNGNVVYETYGDGDLFNAIFCVYGAQVSDRLIRISYDNAYLKLDGFIGQQELNRPNRSYQSLFVNGRYIRSYPIAGAVMRAYDTRLMGGRFPFFVLNLTIAPQEMDVNVHPSKMEVRFTDEQRVTGSVYAACRDALMRFDSSAPASDAAEQTPAAAAAATVSIPRAIERMFDKPRQTSFEMNERPVYSNFPSEPPHADVKVPTIRLTSDRARQPYRAPEPVRILSDTEAYTVVGCLFRTYWLVSAGDDIYLIDQHAAHERQLYERYLAREVALSAQHLLVPAPVTLTPSEMELLRQYGGELEALGFSWRETGALQADILSMPVLNGTTLREPYLHEALSLLGSRERNVPLEMCRDRIIRSACKHAVKAGEDMSEEELLLLLAEYADAATPLTCPHGRPVILRFHRRDLEKLFKRIV